MTAVAVLSQEQLEAIVDRAVKKALESSSRLAVSDVMTREQVAEMLQVHPAVITRYVRGKGLPGTKLGRDWRFRRSEVEAWLATHGGRSRGRR